MVSPSVVVVIGQVSIIEMIIMEILACAKASIAGRSQSAARCLYQAEIFGFVRAIPIGNVPEAERR
jgi:hypothetical protein